jgi:hypothetical protein
MAEDDRTAAPVVHHTVEFDSTDPAKIAKLVEYARELGIEQHIRDTHEVEDGTHGW